MGADKLRDHIIRFVDDKILVSYKIHADGNTNY